MAKNAFSYLNRHDVLWVDTLIHKHGMFNFWVDHIPPKCSWFFRRLCRIAFIIKPYMWINSFILRTSSFLLDPWYFEISIDLKPTFLNVGIDFNSIDYYDLLVENHLNMQALTNIFGEHLFMSALNLSIIDTHGGNHWVWHPNNKGHKLSTKVYTHFNQKNACFSNHWVGLNLIWKMRVTPRTKHFIWLMLHRKISTYDYLHYLGFGSEYSLCSLQFRL